MNSQYVLSTALVSAMVFSSALSAQDNKMNPAISMVLQGQYAGYGHAPDHYELPGFMLGGEAGVPAAGFALGHGELVMSSNIDDLFFGKLSMAIADHEGATEMEMEEAFIETVGLGSGLKGC